MSLPLYRGSYRGVLVEAWIDPGALFARRIYVTLDGAQLTVAGSSRRRKWRRLSSALASARIHLDGAANP